MTRPHATPSILARRLGPSPTAFAAAAALYDPRLLLELAKVAK
jgi:hypothetical protein